MQTNTNFQTVKGVSISTGSGAIDEGTIRVVTATGGGGGVTSDVNLTQVVGNALSVDQGIIDNGCLRVTLGNYQGIREVECDALTQLYFVGNDPVAVGAGPVDFGTQRVVLPNDVTVNTSDSVAQTSLDNIDTSTTSTSVNVAIIKNCVNSNKMVVKTTGTDYVGTNQVQIGGVALATSSGYKSSGTQRIQLSNDSIVKRSVSLYNTTYENSVITQKWEVRVNGTTYTQGSGNTATPIGTKTTAAGVFYARSTDAGDANKTFLVVGYNATGSVIKEVIALTATPTLTSATTLLSYMTIIEFSYYGSIGTGTVGVVSLSAEDLWGVGTGVPANHAAICIDGVNGENRGHVGYILIPPGFMLVINSFQLGSCASQSSQHSVKLCRRSVDSATSVYSTVRETFNCSAIFLGFPVFFDYQGVKIPYKGNGTNFDVFWVEALAGEDDPNNETFCSIDFHFWPL